MNTYIDEIIKKNVESILILKRKEFSKISN